MGDSETADLERSLRALAEEDRQLHAPSPVHAAVMQTWDALIPFARNRHRRRSRGLSVLAIGSFVAAVVAVVAIDRPPSGPSWPEPVGARPTETPRVVGHAPASASQTLVQAHSPRPRRPRTRREKAPPRYQPGLVLVADPGLDASALNIVRVRVPRAALATLGIPVIEPNDGGSVDLEMLVGEDGVARTVRRAEPVAVRQE